MKFDLIKGNADPIQGWISPRYGVKVPAQVICSTQTGKTVQFLTLLIPGQLAHTQDWTIESVPNNTFSSSNTSTCFETTDLCVRTKSIIDLWTFRLSSLGTIDIKGLRGNFQFDGEMLGQRYDQSGRLRAVLATQARYLSLNGSLIFKQDKAYAVVMIDCVKKCITKQGDGKYLTEGINL